MLDGTLTKRSDARQPRSKKTLKLAGKTCHVMNPHRSHAQTFNVADPFIVSDYVGKHGRSRLSRRKLPRYRAQAEAGK